MRIIFDNKKVQHKASIRRHADAKILRANRHWRGAMYLYGYAFVGIDRQQ
jgi:hypothetical protein